MRAFLESKELSTQQFDIVVQLVDTLVGGGKNMGPPVYPQEHTILVSGVRIGQGNIGFWVNDSANRIQCNVLIRSYIVAFV